MRKMLLLIASFLLLSWQLLAQTRTISGKVTDDKSIPIPNASVTIKGSSVGTTSNADGSFTLTVPDNAKTLVITAVGMASQEIAIRSRTTFDVSLKLEDKSLQEVVIVGYSKTTKEAFTGSAKVVSGEQLNNKNVSNISNALAGEVAGVRAITTTGQPGASATIRIRGIGSVNGNRSPLYVVDGVPYAGSLNTLNMEDVASATVLKDAAATAIYGSRGSNGVIVITTRDGRNKKSFIEVDGKYGSNMRLLPRYDVITSPEEYIELAWQAAYNRGIGTGLDDAAAKTFASNRLFNGTSGMNSFYNMWSLPGNELIDPATGKIKPTATRKYTPEDWEDYAFQSSNRQEVNLKMGGGDSKTNYYTSFGYLDDIGYSIQSDFKRLTGRLNLNHEVKSWLTTSMNINYANTRTNNQGQINDSRSIFWFVDNMPPIYPLFLRDPSTGEKVDDPYFGGYQFDYGFDGRKFGSFANAIADAKYNTRESRKNELTGNASIILKPIKDLSFENRLGVNYYNNLERLRENKFYGGSAEGGGYLSQTRTELLNLNLLSMLRYAHRFGSHDIEVLAAHEATDFKQNIANLSATGLVQNNALEFNNAVVTLPMGSYTNTNTLESYFAQVNYNYDQTYYLAGTIRRDGSSRFLSGNKWGTFGSVGAGWIVSNMGFMQNSNISNTINYLKLKASYGVLGDQAGLGYYPGLDLSSINNLHDEPSLLFQTKGNPDLTWETSKMFQAGVEFNLGTYLTGSIDYYVKNTTNLMFDRRIGPSSGYALIRVNDGKLRNSGIEFDLTGHIIKKKNYFIDLNINGEHFNNKITAMPLDPSNDNKPKVIDVQSPFGWAKDHSIYDFYMRNFAGVDPADGRSIWTVFYDDANDNKQFDAGEQVVDLENYYATNPDKKGKLLTGTTKTFSQATQHYIGKSAIPKVRGGVNLRAGYKGFSLAVQVLYSFGGYAFEGNYQDLMSNGSIGGNNWSTDIRNAWKKPGDITDVPRLSDNLDQNVNSTSSRFVTKANYLALNNVRLGYSFPASILKNVGIVDNVDVWVSGDNLWLHSAKKGFNPAAAETGASARYTYSPLSTISAGIRVRF
jgi:TonB-linked SusC/RagA family outer membrane protein